MKSKLTTAILWERVKSLNNDERKAVLHWLFGYYIDGSGTDKFAQALELAINSAKSKE